MVLPPMGMLREKTLFGLDENQVRRARAEIDQQRRAFQVAVIVAEGVVERHRRGVDDLRAEPAAFDGAVELIEQIGLDRHEHDFHLAVLAAADELIIPHDFLDRERHVLLRLEPDDLLDLFLGDRGQFDEARKDVLTRNGVIDQPALDLEIVAQAGGRQPSLGQTGAFRTGIAEDLGLLVGVEHQTAIFGLVEFRETDGLRAEIQTDDASGSCHDRENG